MKQPIGVVYFRLVWLRYSKICSRHWHLIGSATSPIPQDTYSESPISKHPPSWSPEFPNCLLCRRASCQRPKLRGWTWGCWRWRYRPGRRARWPCFEAEIQEGNDWSVLTHGEHLFEVHLPEKDLFCANDCFWFFGIICQTEPNHWLSSKLFSVSHGPLFIFFTFLHKSPISDFNQKCLA